MTIISKKKNRNPWWNCQKYALKLFWNAYTWHVLEDLIFYGPWTNSHDQSQNGPMLVTNGDSFTFIIHVIINHIVMWETLPNIADWDCFKTPMLHEIWRIKNLLQVEHCAFLDAIRVFQSVGCFSFAQFNRIRNHLLGRRIEIRWCTRTWLMGSDRCSSSRKHVSEWSRTVRPARISNAKGISWNDWWSRRCPFFPQTCILLVGKLCCTSLKTMKQWSRWS